MLPDPQPDDLAHGEPADSLDPLGLGPTISASLSEFRFESPPPLPASLPPGPPLSGASLSPPPEFSTSRLPPPPPPNYLWGAPIANESNPGPPEPPPEAPSESEPHWGKTYSVPSRFGIGTIMIFTALLAVTLRAFDAMGAPRPVLVFVLGLMLVVGLAQAVLFARKRPRFSSLIAGIAVCDLVYLAFMIAALFRGGSPRHIAQTIALMFLVIPLTPLGAALGYVAGAALAGVFLVMDKVDSLIRRPPEESAEPV